MKYLYFFIMSVALLFFSGCSKFVSVGGKVIYQDDGSPVTVGQVAFENGDFVARAYVDAQGNYRMGRIQDGDGIPPGTYHVYMYDANIYEAPTGGSSIVKPQVSAKYSNPKTSELTCEVKGKTVFNFKVERP